jgi:hypothetical protein
MVGAAGQPNTSCILTASAGAFGSGFVNDLSQCGARHRIGQGECIPVRVQHPVRGVRGVQVVVEYPAYRGASVRLVVSAGGEFSRILAQ